MRLLDDELRSLRQRILQVAALTRAVVEFSERLPNTSDSERLQALALVADECAADALSSSDAALSRLDALPVTQ